ncbi:hypothetical protein Sjap_021837 [Stephania japonica]|uniref:FAD-binding domain-containing protein n=1 Tax=Stephania japonica TaxID=461633 RepID=A0AAP0EMS0_9MAGN
MEIGGDQEGVEDVVIVGGGIAGLATTLALRRVGVQALVLERSDQLRASGGAILLFSNAWVALEALGVAHKLSSIYPPLQSGYVTNESGEVVSHRTSQESNMKRPVRIVKRKDVLEAIADELPTNTIRFSSKLSSIETRTNEASSLALLHMEDGSIIKTKVLIGCDGVHSVVASWLGLSKPVYSSRSALRGLGVMPQGHGLNNESHIFLQDGYRVGVGPLNDREAHWFIIYNCTSLEEDEENMIVMDPKILMKKVLQMVANFPPLFLQLVQHTDPATLTWAPLMFRIPWDLMFRNLSIGIVTVAGDALHPMTPELGQGGCTSLEDAVVLGRHIGTCFLKDKIIQPLEVAKVLKLYAKERRFRSISLILASYVFGWFQLEGSFQRLKSYVRDTIFFKYVYQRTIAHVTKYDCGKLPVV